MLLLARLTSSKSTTLCELRDGVDEAVDRQSPGQGIGIGYEALRDASGMQGIAAVDQHAIENAILTRDLLEQRGVAVDVLRARHIRTVVLRLERSEVGVRAYFVQVFEAGLAVPVEGGAAEVRLE